MSIIEHKLNGHPFLKGMKPGHLDILARHMREVEFVADQTIFHQSEHAHQFHLILEGSVAVETYVARADNIPVQIVNAGEVLGWSWLFPPFVWHFQARTMERTKAILIDGARLLVACEECHGFGYEIMQRIAQVVITRLEATQSRLLEIQKKAGALPMVDEPRRDRVAAPRGALSLEEMLAEHSFLKGMRAEHLKILAKAAMKIKFEAGQMILQEGDPANRFYLIQQGKVVLEVPRKDAIASPFQTVADGAVLGWSWMFAPFYSHFDARALEPTECIFLYGSRLREVCEQNHELGYGLMKRTVAVVIERLQATRGRLLEISALKEAKTTGGAMRVA